MLILNFVLPIIDLLRNTNFIKSLKYWRSIQNLDSKSLHELQQTKLSAILLHATNNISYYKFLNHKSNLSLKDFPILYKSSIKNNIEDFMWHPHLKHKLICEKSSGSSGVQGSIYMSKKEQSKIIALQTLLWEWAGYKLGTPMLQTGMNPQRTILKKLKDIGLNINYQTAFGLTDEAIISILSKLNDSKKYVFGGYASSLFVYAQVAEKYNLDIQFKCTISWGDKLFDHYRNKIESVFKCKVFDIYGATEGFVIAGQYDLPYQYILTPQVYVELLDTNGNEVPDGEIGHVVVTHLDNYEMPLIRYYLGDLAIKLPAFEYPENRKFNFPLFKKIIGRDTDIVVTPKGTKLIVHAFTIIFEHLPQIKQFRVIQEKIEGIIIEYIPDYENNFSNDILKTVERKILLQINEEFEIQFIEVSTIPDSPSGKPQMIVSKINKQQWI